MIIGYNYFSVQLLLKEIFQFNNRHLPSLDHIPCIRCGIIPEIKIIHKKTKKGREMIIIDRSNRIDCEEDSRHFKVYHIICWNLLVLEKNVKRARHN